MEQKTENALQQEVEDLEFGSTIWHITEDTTSANTRVDTSSAKPKSAKDHGSVQHAIYDTYATARHSKHITRGETGLIMDDFMDRHFNPWDENHIERPERLTYIRERLGELGLTQRCRQVMKVVFIC